MNKLLNLGNSNNLLLGLLLLMSFTLPRVAQEEKFIVLAILLFINFKKGSFLIESKHVVFYTFLFVFPFLVAVFKGNEWEFILGGLRVYYLFPVLLYIVFCSFSPIDFERVFSKITKISIVLISVSGLISFMYALNISPINVNSLFYDQEEYVGIHEGYFHIVNSPLSYLVFLVPIYFYRGVDFDLKSTDFYLFVFTLMICLISSRRILLLPFLLVFIFNFKRMKFFLVALVLIFTILILTGKIDILFLNTYLERMIAAINSTDDSIVRDEQKSYMLKYIVQSPFEGYGLGAYMEDYLRNSKFKSAYEATFHYMVYVVGIPMSFVFFAYYYFLYRRSKLCTSFSKNFIYGILLGSLSLILASYTNPYWLSNFDYCIPLAVIFTFINKK